VNLEEVRKALGNNPGLFSSPPEEIGVCIVSDRAIRKINREFLGRDCATDVMSFRISRKYGEIIISAETAMLNGPLYGKSFGQEIVYLAIHGYLHLKNYRDYTPPEREKMLKLQDEIYAGIDWL